MSASAVDVVIVGAGPCGLAAAIAMREVGLDAVVFDRSCVASSIARYPTYLTFFSTAERISIGGLPFVIAGEKPTRREGLAYYRAVVSHFALDVRQYEGVEGIERVDASGMSTSAALPARFLVRTRTRGGREGVTLAGAVVIATGYFGTPNLLGAEGESLPHVTHFYRDGHEAFQRDALVVGGGNSAVEVALDLARHGARATIVHFGPTWDRNIKPWVLPDVTNRIADGSIGIRWNARVACIGPETVTLRTMAGEEVIRADHVYVMTGFTPHPELLRQLDVEVDGATGVPVHDPSTMETETPLVFIAGVLASGNDANKIFIENGRHYGGLIAARLSLRSEVRGPRSEGQKSG